MTEIFDRTSITTHSIGHFARPPLGQQECHEDDAIDGQWAEMHWITPIAAAALCAGLQAGVMPPASASEPRAAPVIVTDVRAPVTILVSIDGFRADYLDRGVTPNLSALAASGAPLLRNLIGLPPGAGMDGDDAPFRAVLLDN